MTRVPHRIRRQRLEVRAPDRDTAFMLRAQMRRDLDDVLLPAMEQAFDAAARAAGIGDAVVRIPRLAVHMRVRNLDAFADSLTNELPALIAEQLEAALSGMARSGTSTRHRTAAEQAHASVLHYLLNGQLDWPDMQGEAAAQVATLREEVIGLTQSWREQPAALRRILPTQYESALAFFVRLLQLLPAAMRDEWISALLTVAPIPGTSAQRQIAQGLRHLSALPVMSTLVEHSGLQVQAMTLAVAWVDSIPAASALRPALLALPGAHAIGIDVIEAILRGSDDASGAPARLVTPSKDKAMPGKRPDPAANVSVQDAERVADTAAADDEVPDALRADAPSSDAADVPPDIDHASIDDDDGDGAALRVQAAGLVLAHPFLPSLFAARGLLSEDGKAVPPSCLPRAAALLHWLACGREEIFEFELGFIKTLLGLRPEDPLPVSQGLLDTADRDECDALLHALISHWPAVGATSLAGLQVSFLQRQGLLRNSEEGLQSGWQLRLESESFDLLLAQLPWSISIVRLPWMTRPIFTEWPTR